MRLATRILALLAITLIPASAQGQGTLSAAAELARQAWVGHDAHALVGQSSSLVLQIPGADPSSPLGRPQAVELLRRYLRSSEERGLDVTAIREVEPGKGFIQMARRYVVSGTTELRQETLYLGFRLLDGEWRLVELRSAP